MHEHSSTGESQQHCPSWESWWEDRGIWAPDSDEHVRGANGKDRGNYIWDSERLCAKTRALPRYVMLGIRTQWGATVVNGGLCVSQSLDNVDGFRHCDGPCLYWACLAKCSIGLHMDYEGVWCSWWRSNKTTRILTTRIVEELAESESYKTWRVYVCYLG